MLPWQAGGRDLSDQAVSANGSGTRGKSNLSELVTHQNSTSSAECAMKQVTFVTKLLGAACSSGSK